MAAGIRAGDEEGEDRPLRVRKDVQAVMTAVGERREAQIEIEKEKEYRLDLIDADLKSVRLSDVNLEGTILIDVDLTGTSMRRYKRSYPKADK